MPALNDISEIAKRIISTALFLLVLLSSNLSYAGWLSDFGRNLNREWSNFFSGGCDVIWKVNRRFDQEVELKGRAFAQGARVEFEAAMDKLFKDKIDPLLKNIDLMVRNNARETVDYALTELDKSIEYIFKSADTTIESAIKKASTELTSQREAIVSDANKLLEFFECQNRGNILSAKMAADELAAKWPFKVPNFLKSSTHCQMKLGLPKDRARYEYTDLFNESECEILRRIDTDTPVTHILDHYGDLQLLSQEFQCLSGKSPIAKKYARKWLEYSYRYNIWDGIKEQ